MRKFINYAETAKDFLQSSVDSAVSNIEQIHLSVADTAFTLLSNGNTPSETLSQAQEKHRVAAQAVYEAIRTVNRRLGELATDGFEMLEDSELAMKARNRDGG